ncbi:MAG: 2-succinyl-6-hydroxy-2,4-cyclohexadiene-1-carboxylate synthase [Chloroflexota bacterium]|nr:2-succinyl-6-hydroxy-2,4-cyclohexadiene-1-carboxylate synthase [Dehalococcoidia bacterium]MDW8254027.1 2-succinyl-6-hydroxy-2,4-cyclohexadiene-1-carboxylate synthase [Chloroflexota bacterium]
MTSVAVRGVRYHVARWGAGPPLVLLHGFTGSVETWRPFRKAWRGRQLIAIDLIGHGRTTLPRDPERATMASSVRDLAALLDALGIARAAVLGYSMGGRLALRFALAFPHRVSALILESASPGIASAQERQERLAADEQRARLLERDGIAAFVEQWEALPLWASQARLPPAVRARLRQQRLACSAEGLALSLRGMGAGAEEPVLDCLVTFAMPVLLIAGAEDPKYVALAQAMADRLPKSDIAILPGAGHATHLEQPAQFAAVVDRFLRSAFPLEPPVR